MYQTEVYSTFVLDHAIALYYTIQWIDNMYQDNVNWSDIDD